LSERIGDAARLIGIIDTMRGTPTKSGGMMQFVTMEDETGLFEVTFFPNAWRRLRRVFTDMGPYLVEGKVESQYGSVSVNAWNVLDVPS
jgi:DNA polymerase III alpha subunit